MSRQHAKVAMVIAAWLSTFVALGVYWHYVREQASATYSWEATTGVITDSSWRIVAEPTGGYGAVVHYTYEVDGDRYESMRVWEHLSFSHEARDVVESFPAGKSLKVYYSPDLPPRSVLQRGTYPQGPRFALESLLFWLLPVPALLLTAGFHTEIKHAISLWRGHPSGLVITGLNQQ